MLSFPGYSLLPYQKTMAMSETAKPFCVHLRLCDFRHDTPLNPPASADKEEDLSSVGSGRVERVLCKQSGGGRDCS